MPCRSFESIKYKDKETLTMDYIKEEITRVDKLGRTLLHNAAISGNERFVEVLVALKIDLDAKDNDGCTAMHLAARMGNINIVNKLIESGANVNISNKTKWTALTYACDRCYEGIVILLLSRGVVIDSISLEVALANAYVSFIGGRILDILKYECNRRIREAVFSRDLRRIKDVIVPLKPLYRLQYNGILFVDSNDTKTTWILKVAQTLNSVPLLKILIDNNILLDLPQNDTNVLSMACECNSLSGVKFLLDKGMPIYALNEKLESCLYIAVRNNNMAMVNLLLSYGASGTVNVQNGYGITPLHIACAYGNQSMVNVLIKAGANMYHKVNLGVFLTCLDSKVYESMNDNGADLVGLESLRNLCVDSMGIACCLGYTRIVFNLIRREYNINRSIDQGNTVLHIACMRNSNDMVKYLLRDKVNININAVNNDGNTALHLACIKSNPYVVLKLIYRGANRLVCNKDGRIPLHIAYEMSSNYVIKLLQSNYNLKQVINWADAYGVTLLHLACKKLDVKKVEFLLSEGAKVSVVDNLGNSPLHHISLSNVKKYRKEKFKTILNMLIEHGLNINSKNTSGKTALDLACEEREIDDACILIEKGATMGIEALDLVMSEGKIEVVLQSAKKRHPQHMYIEKVAIHKNDNIMQK